MSILRPWLLRMFMSAAACGALLAPLDASAGTVQVKDSDALLSAADVAALRSEGEALPFDVRVVTTDDHPEKADLDRFVHEQLAAPNMVVIGLDRAHRHTAVHFGTATGVPATAFRAIEQAGNASFRDGNWRGGISAILRETRAASRPGATSSAATGAVPAPSNGRAGASTAMWGLLIVLAIAGVIVFVGVTLARRAKAGMLGSTPGALPPGMLPPQGPGAPGGPPGAGYPPGPGYGPGYGYPQGGYGAGGGGIGRNIAAAGLGGFLGYELGKMAGEHGEARGHDPEQSAAIGGGHHQDDNGVASPDAGGAAGAWDDDTSSDTGGDWGGSDAGGGGDWGGGDSGGGGSDW